MGRLFVHLMTTLSVIHSLYGALLKYKGKNVMPGNVTRLEMSIAINEKYIFIVDRENGGSIVSYEYNGRNIKQVTRLQPSGIKQDDNFGVSVAANNNNNVISGNCGNSIPKLNGSAYVAYLQDMSWSYQKIVPSDRSWEDITGFGITVDINEDNVVAVGAPSSDELKGSVYIFSAKDTRWTQIQKIMDSKVKNYTAFGFAVSISNTRLLIGAPVRGYVGRDQSGIVYIYEPNSSSKLWHQVHQLKPPLLNGKFGSSLSIDNERIFISAPSVDNFRGCVYIYINNNNNWTLEARIAASDGRSPDRFGWDISVHKGVLVVGTFRKGVAYVFKGNDGRWKENARLGNESIDANPVAVRIYDETVAMVKPGGLYLFDLRQSDLANSFVPSLLPFSLLSYLTFISLYIIF